MAAACQSRPRWSALAMLLLALLMALGLAGCGRREDVPRPANPPPAEPVWGTKDGVNTGLAGESPYAADRRGYVVASLSGRWAGVIDMGTGNRLQFSFNFREADGQLSGTAIFPIGAGGIEDGKVVGNQLWFTTRHQLPSSGQPLLTTFSGELSDEGVLHLTMLAEGSESRLTLTPSPI